MQAIYKAVLLAAFLVVLGLLFQALITLMIAILITVIIAVALTSWTDRLERHGIPRPIGAILGILLALIGRGMPWRSKRPVHDVSATAMSTVTNPGALTT